MQGTDIQEILSRLSATLEGAGLDVVAIVSAIIALLGAYFSWRETRKQRKLKLETMRRELDHSSLNWGCEVIELVARAETLIMHGQSHYGEREFESQRQTLMSELSAMIDQGRFYFPNVEDETHGAEKEGAYQGKRPPVLDAVVYVYYELSEASYRKTQQKSEVCEFLKSCRRLLVSELQSHLDPKTRNAVIERFNHRMEDQREDAIYRAGQLGLEINNRHAGILTHKNDAGWTFYAQERNKTLSPSG